MRQVLAGTARRADFKHNMHNQLLFLPVVPIMRMFLGDMLSFMEDLTWCLQVPNSSGRHVPVEKVVLYVSTRTR